MGMTDLAAEHDIDSAPPERLKRWQKLLTIAVGFGTDAYDLFVVNIILMILRDIYGNQSWESFISSSVLSGAIIGQIVFGNLADKIGRKAMFLVTLTLMIIFSGLSAVPFLFDGAKTVFIFLGLCRLFLGFGIGGEYPLSAILTAESSTSATRGRDMALVFSAQGWGNFTAAALSCAFLVTHIPLNWIMAILLAFPAIPCIISAYPRLLLTDSERYLHNTQAKLTASHGFCGGLGQWFKHSFRTIAKHKKALIGTAGSWFLFDITFYGNGLFNATVLQILGLADEASSMQLSPSDSPTRSQLDSATGSLIIAAIGLPGYWFAVLLSEKMGRKRMQFVGFAMIAIIFVLMGAFFTKFKSGAAPGWIFIVLYGLTFFFSNFGPNTTTYVIPGEVFPPTVSATCHGLSAASGKVGAVLGAAIFKPVSDKFGFPATFFGCAAVAVLGFLITFLVPDVAGKDLEQFDNPMTTLVNAEELTQVEDDEELEI